MFAVGRRGARRSRRGRVRDEEEEEEEDNECPICKEVFNRSGRTKVYPFACASASGHGHCICRSCNRRMFERHDDACPLCRCARIDHSSMGRRGPPPASHDDAVFEAAQFVNGVIAGLEPFDAVPPDFIVQIPVSSRDRMPSSNSIVVVDRRVHRRGSRAVVPIRSSNARSGEGEDDESARHVVDQILADPVVQAAIEGLHNPQRGGVRGFPRGDPERLPTPSSVKGDALARHPSAFLREKKTEKWRERGSHA